MLDLLFLLVKKINCIDTWSFQAPKSTKTSIEYIRICECRHQIRISQSPAHLVAKSQRADHLRKHISLPFSLISTNFIKNVDFFFHSQFHFQFHFLFLLDPNSLLLVLSM
jgi:hypothetical protein